MSIVVKRKYLDVIIMAEVSAGVHHKSRPQTAEAERGKKDAAGTNTGQSYLEHTEQQRNCRKGIK